MKRIMFFETTDGQKYRTSKEAKAHEAQLTLDKLLAQWFADTETVNAVQLRNLMIDASWQLINVLSDIARKAPLLPDASTDAEHTELADAAD